MARLVLPAITKGVPLGLIFGPLIFLTILNLNTLDRRLFGRA